MPWAAQHLALPLVGDLGAGHGGPHEAGQPSLAERPALVRAAVAQREQLALDVEDADLPASHFDDLARADRDLLDRSDDVGRQAPNPPTAARPAAGTACRRSRP